MRYQSTTGLSRDQLVEIVDRIRQLLWAGARPAMMPSIVDLESQVEMVLMIARQNLIQTVVADWFEVSQPTVSRVYRSLLPLLDQVLCVHEPDLASVMANREPLVDGTDIATGNRKNGDENYSGKRHRQCLNIQVMASEAGSLLAVSRAAPGCRHDRRAFAESGWEEILTDHQWLADSAYLGTNATTPKKRTKNRDLTDHERAVNKSISSRRSAVERCIAHLKNWKILATGYRVPWPNSRMSSESSVASNSSGSVGDS